MHKKRVIQVGVICLLLAIAFSVGGCFPSRSTIEAEVYTVLNRLEYAMLSKDIDLILMCYTDPFYFYSGGQVSSITHYQLRSELTDFFKNRSGYYELYELREPLPYKLGLTEAKVTCDLHIKRYSSTNGYEQASFNLEYTLVKHLGHWKIRQIVNRNPVSVSQTLSILGLPQE